MCKPQRNFKRLRDMKMFSSTEVMLEHENVEEGCGDSLGYSAGTVAERFSLEPVGKNVYIFIFPDFDMVKIIQTPS
jgi:hypothetical protein